VISNDFPSGNALRVTYSVYSGVKYSGNADVDVFGGDNAGSSAIASATLAITSALLSGYDGITTAGAGNVHSYITFPGMGMRPIFVTAAGADSINVSGRAARTKPPESSRDIVSRGVIRPYHDIYFVRAGVAYVDDTSTFCFADITTDDISAGSLPSASALTGAAHKIEGIKAVRFAADDSNADGAADSVTVFVVAEGDSNITGRQSSEGSASQEFRKKPEYAGMTFDPEVYYEEFEMRWRTRNVEAPET
jgi:hypothetical protein